MQVNIGDIVEGKVTGLTNFGAFVKLSTGEVGMVHISELEEKRVKEVKDVCQEGDEIVVKVLAIDEKGKIKLKIMTNYSINEYGLIPSISYSPKVSTGIS